MMNTDQAREFLIKFMEENFTDTTYHRYILGDTQRISLAGDFAWQIATAINDVQLASAAIIERQTQEVLKLHRDLAAEKLRADQGWHRYESANSRKNELEAERANWAQEIAVLKAQQLDKLKDASQLTPQELSDPEYMKAYIEGCNESFAEAMREIVRLRTELFQASQSSILAQESKPLCYVRQSDIDSPIGSAIWAYRMAGGEWSVPMYVGIKDQSQ